MQRGIAQLGGVVRRNGCRHADRDAGGAVRQQIGKGARQDDRLAIFPIIGGTKIDGVFVEALEQ